MKTYAIGDVHGEIDMLNRALEWIEEDAGNEEARLVTLGDYVDRGPNSCAVIERLMTWNKIPQVNLAGNHDQMMLMAAKGHEGYADVWMCNGGRETLLSYEIEVVNYPARAHDFVWAARKLPREHVEWLEQLGTSADDGVRFFCHAGCVPGVLLEEQSMDDLLWYRHPKGQPDHDFGRVIVHGHTPNLKGPYIGKHRINLDTGACFGGRLTVARWDDEKVGVRPHIFQVSPIRRDQFNYGIRAE